MSFFTAEEETFRDEVRAFIFDTLPEALLTRGRRGYHPVPGDVVLWTRALNARGWSVPNWPVEYGGPGWTLRQRHIFEEECFLIGAPPLSPQGTALVGPVIYTYGSDAQKALFLPAIANGDHLWAQGFSEPNSGSDLASLRTKAERDGDDYIVNGQKIWTSEAHCSDWLFLLVRTRFEGKPQGGISFLLVDMETPGITIRPIISIDEGHSLNEVFLDNVRVPAANLVGEENAGWTYAKMLLGEERSFSAMVPRCKRELARLKDNAAKARTPAGPLASIPTFARRIAELEVELVAHETTTWRVLAEEEAGEHSAVPTSSILKIKGTELLQDIELLSAEALGDEALPVYPEAEYLGELPPNMPGRDHAPGLMSELFYRRSATIYGGTNEIQRNIIASTLLKG